MRYRRRNVNATTVGFVYALRCGPWVKIGTSYTPEQRMDAIDRVCPPTEALYILTGGVALENELHQRLHAHRVKNEWFEASAEVLSTLQEVWKRQQPGKGKSAPDAQLALI